MALKEQISVRASSTTVRQLAELAERWETTKTEVITLLIAIAHATEAEDTTALMRALQDVARGAESGERRNLTEALIELAAELPASSRDELPSDLAAQHDHYLYGTPKREP